MSDHNPYFGVIAVGEKETDFQLGSEVKIKPARNSFNDKRTQYAQNEVSAVSCTIHGAMGAVTDLTGYVFPLEERKALWKQALALGASPTLGWFTASAVDLVRNFYNAKFPDKPLKSFRAVIGYPEFWDMLDMGYTAVISHKGNTKYNSDVKLDGILDGTSFGNTTYGHVIRGTEGVKDQYHELVNNYPGSAHNVYRVAEGNLKALMDNSVLFRNCYFYVEDYELDGNIPVWGLSSWEKAKKKGLVKAGEDFSKRVGDTVMEDHLIKLGVFSRREGSVSLIRWIVALDLMGKL